MVESFIPDPPTFNIKLPSSPLLSTNTTPSIHAQQRPRATVRCNLYRHGCAARGYQSQLSEDCVAKSKVSERVASSNIQHSPPLHRTASTLLLLRRLRILPNSIGRSGQHITTALSCVHLRSVSCMSPIRVARPGQGSPNQHFKSQRRLR